MGRSEEKARERLGIWFENPRFSFVEHDINLPLGEKAEKIGYVDYVIHGASTTHPVKSNSIFAFVVLKSPILLTKQYCTS